jgi:hypothetical protein
LHHVSPEEEVEEKAQRFLYSLLFLFTPIQRAEN